MTKPLILGTAGHIDHGKSTLVHALSGTDPDRLPEEKKRGITIELGFAKMQLGSRHFGIVDVPGHERFVRTMVAGATGIDLVILVIAADEGIMPQTREHLDICQLLGIRHGLVALTKTDMVDEEWLELVLDDVQNALQDSFLEGSPILPVSAKTGDGLDALRQALLDVAEQVQGKERKGLTRLPIDRVFEQRGFGPVVTGTLHAGTLREGDPVMLLPPQIRGRVRGLQVHSQSVPEALAGQRTAVNIQGIPLAEIHRGHVLISASTLNPVPEAEARITLLPHLPKGLKQRASVLVHVGTVQINARLWLHDQEQWEPGHTGFARLLLEEPTVLMPGDRFILRGFQRFADYGTTLGGGEILDMSPPNKRRRDPYLLERLQLLDQDDPATTLALFLKESEQHGLDREELAYRTGFAPKPLTTLIAQMQREQSIVRFEKDPDRFIHQESLVAIGEELQQRLTQYHENHPLEERMSRESLREQLRIQSPKLFNLLLQRLTRDDLVVLEQDGVRLSRHKVRLAGAAASLEQAILQHYEEAGLTPPRARDLPALLNEDEEELQPILELLTRRQQLRRVVDDLYFNQAQIQQLQEQLIDFLTEHGEITPQQFKQMTGASRKFTIPLAEFFDKQQITARSGDIRKLRYSAQRAQATDGESKT